MDFSGSCSHCRRIMVDWEDKGLLDLLDMDHVICDLGGDGEQIIDIRNCTDCPLAVFVNEEEVSDEEIKKWIKWSIIGRFNLDEYSEEDITGQYGPENSEE